MDDINLHGPYRLRSNGHKWERCDAYRGSDTGRYIGAGQGQHWSYRPKRCKGHVVFTTCAADTGAEHGPKAKRARKKKATKPQNNARFLSYADAPYMAPQRAMGLNLTTAKEELIEVNQRNAEQAKIIAEYLEGQKS